MVGFFFQLSVNGAKPLIATSKNEGVVRALWNRFFSLYSSAEVVERKENKIVFNDAGCRRMIDYGSYHYDGTDPFKDALVTL